MKDRAAELRQMSIKGHTSQMLIVKIDKMMEGIKVRSGFTVPCILVETKPIKR